MKRLGPVDKVDSQIGWKMIQSFSLEESGLDSGIDVG
jgi:hypothetical protein